METCDLRSNCPINFVLELVGDKWSLLIIRDIIFNAKSSYSDFLASDEKIATNILASRLAHLESEGLLRKVPTPANKARYNYVLTPMAIDLVPMFVEMILWSEKHSPIPIPAERAADLEKVKADRHAYTQEIQERIRLQTAQLVKP